MDGGGDEGYGFIAIFKEFSINTQMFSLSLTHFDYTQSHLFHRSIILCCHRISIIVKLWRRRLLSRYRKK
jgi:hypothetical protein